MPSANAGGLLVQEGLVALGIEGLAGGIVGGDAVAVEEAQKLAVDQLDPHAQRAFVAARLERPLEVVDGGDELAEDRRGRLEAGLLPVALDALPEVLEVGAAAQQLLA